MNAIGARKQLGAVHARWSRACCALSLLLLTSGCAWMSGYDAEGRPLATQFTVELSSLDWIELSYMPRPDDPVFATPCRLSLMGSGEIEFRTGRSPQVWSTFSDKVDDPHWNELYTDRLNIGDDGMQELFQEFVDAGLFPRWSPRNRKEDMTTPFVKINAKIGQERTLRVLSDRRTVRIVERVLAQFEATALLALQAGGRR